MSAGIVAQRRELRSQIRERRGETLPKLRESVKVGRARRKKAVTKCRADCKRKRARAMERTKQARVKLRERIMRAREVARAACKACTLTAGMADIDKALAAVEAERVAIRTLAYRAGSMVSEHGKAGGLKAAELREESDSLVELDLDNDREMIALFRKVKRQIKGSRHQSRTEAFLQYVHDNPHELDELRAQQEIEYSKELAETLEDWLERQKPIGKMDTPELEAFSVELERVDQLLEDAPF